jgi:hypothetical protein
MPTRHAQQSQLAAVSAALFRTWLAGAKPGQRLEYHRGALALDRSKATSSLKRAERRKLATVADHVLALAEKGKLHLIQERHGDGDYSYWAVARAPARSIQLVANRFSTTDAPDNGASNLGPLRARAGALEGQQRS